MTEIQHGWTAANGDEVYTTTDGQQLVVPADHTTLEWVERRAAAWVALADLFLRTGSEAS